MTLRIAHVNVSKDYRGGERQTELLARELEKTDIQQILVARRDAPLAERCQNIDLEIRTVSGNPLTVAMATKDVDLVHAHDGRSVYGAYLRSLISKVPYIATRRINNPIRNRYLAHKVYQRAASVVAVASKVAETVKSFDSEVNVQVIYSGSSGFSVNQKQSDLIKSSFPGKFLVGNIGALENQQKGQEYVIEVARDLQHSHPDIQFLLIGEGRDEKMLKKSAVTLKSIFFTGFVENVGDYLAALDLFILPSNKEGIGGILIDAMEQKVPIIASRVGGIPEIVHDKKNGILIDPRSPDQLKAAILRLHASEQKRRTLGSQGYELAKNFTANVMAQKYLNLYRNTVKTKLNYDH